MRKLYFVLSAMLTCIFAQAQDFSFRSILFNPINVGFYETIDIQGPPNTFLTNVWFVVIDGESGGNPGNIEQAIIMDDTQFPPLGATTGDNGLLLIQAGGFTPNPAPDAETVTEIYNFSPDLGNGSKTYALVISASAITVGTDLDTDNDGDFDVAVPWTSVEDAVGYDDGGAGDQTYGVTIDGTLGTDIQAASDGAQADALAFEGGMWFGVNIGDGASPIPSAPGGPYRILHVWDENGVYQPYYSSFTLLQGIITAVLPVELFVFEASNVNNRISLIWKTAQEANSSHFDVQRSVDGKHFETIGRVNAAGNSSTPRSYNYSDNAAKGSIVYYRLQMTDLDATFEYSHVVKVKLGTGLISINNIYPSPARDMVTVEWNSREKVETRIMVRDLSGRVVFNNSIQSNLGFNKYSIPVRSLTSGQYMIQLVSADGVMTDKFVKF